MKSFSFTCLLFLFCSITGNSVILEIWQDTCVAAVFLILHTHDNLYLSDSAWCQFRPDSLMVCSSYLCSWKGDGYTESDEKKGKKEAGNEPRWKNKERRGRGVAEWRGVGKKEAERDREGVRKEGGALQKNIVRKHERESERESFWREQPLTERRRGWEKERGQRRVCARSSRHRVWHRQTDFSIQTHLFPRRQWQTWGLWWARWHCRPSRGGHPGVRDCSHTQTYNDKHHAFATCMHAYICADRNLCVLRDTTTHTSDNACKLQRKINNC